jgi:hypothetical protein
MKWMLAVNKFGETVMSFTYETIEEAYAMYQNFSIIVDSETHLAIASMNDGEIVICNF